MICACATLAPATTTSPNITAIVFSCLFITLFSLIREGDLFNRSPYYPRADRSATAAPGAPHDRGGRVSGRTGRQKGNQADSQKRRSRYEKNRNNHRAGVRAVRTGRNNCAGQDQIP